MWGVFLTACLVFLAKPPSWEREPLALSLSHHTSHMPPQALTQATPRTETRHRLVTNLSTGADEFCDPGVLCVMM